MAPVAPRDRRRGDCSSSARGWSVGDTGALFVAVLAVGIGLAMGGGIEGGRITYQLARSPNKVATLSVAAERERIGRDLHDILGHSLTAISIKSGLAGETDRRRP